MKLLVKENKLLCIIIVLSLLVALAAVGGRLFVESKNKTYDIVLDYHEIEAMAEQSDQDVSWWLRQFKEMGITKVGLLEENLVTLMEDTEMPISATVMDIIMKDADWEKDYPESFIQAMYENGFDRYDLLVESASKESFDFISKAITERYKPDKYLINPSETGGYILLNGTAKETLYTEKYKYMNSIKKGFIEQDEIVSSKLMYLNYGMLPSKVSIIQDAGMKMMPRTASYEGWNDSQYVKAVIKSYSELGVVPEYMIVGGEAIIGLDDGIEIASNYITENNITLGLIENTTQLQNLLQLGVNEAVVGTDYNSVRVFSVWDYIQNRYQYYGYEGAKEIENTLFRAVVERNIRLIYFKPIKEFKDQHVYVTDIEEYQTMFTNLEDRLSEHGFRFGETAPMKPYQVNLLIKLSIAIGCVAAAVLLIRTILPIDRRWKMGLTGLGIVGVLGTYYVMPAFAELITSFAAAVIFACLATAFLVKQSKSYADKLNKDEKLNKIIFLSIATLVGAVVLSLLGGMMTAAPISSISHMLEIDIFRGVKLAQLLPLVFFIIVYLAYYGFGENKRLPGRLEFRDLHDLMNASIKVWMVVIGVLVAGVGAYYILRTGHDSSIEVSNFEMLFRNTLEDKLLARPRTKEFLFAFPAVMMMVYTSVRRFKLWPIIFGLASVIGLTSVINTFMHIRTPLYLGFIRTGYSLLFGIIIGIIAIFVFELLHKLYKKLERQII